MPVKDNLDSSKLEGQNVVDSTPIQIRELTQTDRLNRSLLQSFLARINQPNFNFNIQTGERNVISAENEVNNFH